VSADEATESRHMDYGHTMAKSPILCSPNSNSNPIKINIWDVDMKA
jgi:hypothetical protein